MLISGLILKRSSCVKLCRRWYSGKLITQLMNRGLIKCLVPENDDTVHHLFGRQQTIYAGFDPTADSLHLGHLAILMCLLHCARDGHRVICIIGDATARIGDPTGRTEERPVMNRAVIEKNTISISACINQIFSNHFKYFWTKTNKAGESNILDPIVLQSSNWHSNTNVIEFLCNIGSNLSVEKMREKKSIQERTDATLAELGYQSLQAYDWFYLHDKYDCHFQLGGVDQMLNVHRGYSLLKDVKGVEKCAGLFVNLLTDKDGKKIGKSGKDQTWLSRRRLSPLGLYQHLVAVPDSEVEQFLKFFTFYPLQQIEHMIQRMLQSPKSKYPQKKLAESVTLLVHGDSGLQSAKTGSKALFENDINHFGVLNESVIKEFLGSEAITDMFLMPGETSALDVVIKLNCFSKEDDCVRAIQEGGFYLNGTCITQPNYEITNDDILPNNTSLIRIGKKRYFVVKWV